MIADGLKLTCDGGVGLAGLVVSRFYGKLSLTSVRVAPPIRAND